MTSTEPSGPTISGAAPPDDVPVAGGPEIHHPGMPPGAAVDSAEPNIIYTSRQKRAETRAERTGRKASDILAEWDDQRRRQGLPVHGDNKAKSSAGQGSTSSSGPFGDRTQERPIDSANKSTWVDYAVSQGANRDDAEKLNKPDLICQYGNNDDE